jgi:hypothetical protein
MPANKRRKNRPHELMRTINALLFLLSINRSAFEVIDDDDKKKQI